MSSVDDAPLAIFSGKDNIPEKLHPVCAACVERARQKYSNFTSDEGTFYRDGFDPPCSFIPHDEIFVPEEIRKDYAEEDIKYINTLLSPLHWAEANLIDPDTGKPFRAWPYQRGPLLCTSKRSVYRFGRRTGKTVILAIRVLWFIFTSGGGKFIDPDTKKVRQNLNVLLITPYKAHIENIFSRMRAFLSLSPHLSKSVIRDRQGSPQEMGIAKSDGSIGNRVLGFATGEASGNKGVSARGQDADLVVMDEGAWVSSDVITNVISPILYTRPTTGMVFSSTPSGISGDYFEKLCTTRPDYSEFYVPARMRPDWEQVKEQVKKDFGSSQEEWDKEVEAKFSPAGIGVYRGDLVRLAQGEYQYGDIKPLVGTTRNGNYIFIVGVDWNKEHGTEIAIVAISKADPHPCFLAYAENIPKKVFTNIMGVIKIVELNRIWLPDWLFVDAGGGDGAELLKHHGLVSAGKNMIDARLMNNVEAYDFGSKIEVAPAEGLPQKFAAKPFMVNFSVSLFEAGLFKYPQSDLLLTRQLNNYIVKHRTQSNVPVYAMKEDRWGDHRLDAVNLALVAARLKFPSFWKSELSNIMAPIGFVPSKDKVSSDQRIILPGVINIIGRDNGLRAIQARHSSGYTKGRGGGDHPENESYVVRAGNRLKNIRRNPFGR